MSPQTARVLYLAPDSADGAARADALDAAGVFTVDRVATVAEAVDRLAETTYDAVVSRYELPSTDGVSFLATVATDDPATTTLLVAAEPTPELRREIEAAGIDSFLDLREADERGGGDGVDGRAERAVPDVERLEERLRRLLIPSVDEADGAGGPDDDANPTRLEEQLTALARATTDAIVTIDDESVVRYANPAVETVLGYAPEELVGERLTTVMRDEMAARHEASFERYLATGERNLDWNDIELAATRKDGSDVPLSISFSEFTHQGERYFTGILRDVTERKSLLAERELLYDVTRRIAEAETFERGLDIALQEVGDAMNWAYGEAWVPDEEGAHLVRRADYVAAEEYEEFRDASAALTFERGTGLPGRVWAAAEHEWVSDLSAESPRRFERARDAETTGLRAGLGVPICAGGAVVAVLVFLLPDSRSPDERMIEATVGVAESLGRLMVRKQAEGALRAERNLKTRIVETAPVGIVIANADGEYDYVNDAARAIFDAEGDGGFPRYGDQEWRAFDVAGNPLSESERPLERVVEAGESYQGELRVSHPDGRQRWLSINGAPLETDDGGGETAVFAFEDVSDRKERERELMRSDAMLETVRDGVYALDDEGRFIAVNRAYAELVGRDRESLLGEHATTVITQQTVAEVDEIQRELGRTDRDVATYETTIETAAGDRVPVESRISLFPLGGDRQGRVGVVRDISDRIRREEQLKQLNEFAQALAASETTREVCDVAVETAEETLGLPLTAVERYDEQSGRLTTLARTPELAEVTGEGPLFEAGDDVAWEVYTEQEARILDDLRAAAGRSDAETPLGSAIVLPVGNFGVFLAGSTEPRAFGEEEVMLANVFVANVEAALERVDREEELRRRTDELETRTQTLERVNRINSVIRQITQVLTQASTREEIEQTVCTQLANAEPYRFAWIGEQHRIDGEIVPRASAGVERGYLESITVTADDGPSGAGPAGRAVRTHEPQVQNNIHSDPPFEPWRTEALQRGYRASIAVPLVYRETLYGVLNLYANAPGVFDDLEVTVLKELGEMIAYAINALERKKALVSNTAVELQFRITDPDVPAVRFAAEENSRLEFDALVEEADGSVRAFFTVSGSSPERIEEHAERSARLTEVNLISERDEGYFYEAVLSEESFLLTLLEAGAHPTELVATGEGADLTVELPSSGDIQAFLTMFLGHFEDADLIARRELDRPVRTEEEFRALYEERLTERQEEVVRTAYYAGFFNFPRDSSGSEVAEMLGVSQPTVNRHIRQAERKLFELVFEDEPPVETDD